MTAARPPRTVLLADDDPDLRRLGVLSLGKIGGWRVVVASHGGEAVEVATREKPDLVILDVSMPVMDGPTALKKLRERAETATIPVIFITARALPDEMAANLALGAIGVVTKPFHPMELPKEIARLLAAANGQAVHAEPEGDAIHAVSMQRDAYAASLPAKLDVLTAAIARARATNDDTAWEAARTMAHKMRGAAGSLGLTLVGESAGRIEEALRAMRTRGERGDEGWEVVDRALEVARRGAPRS